jgi:CBS-domain-containing membrane protein
MTIQDIMTRDVQTCRPESNLAAAAEKMWRGDCGALPVVDPFGKVVGIITDRDIAIALGTKHRVASDVTVGEVMSSNVFVCGPDDDIGTAVNTIEKKKVRRLPVVYADWKLHGLVALNDLALNAGESPDSAITLADVGRTLRAVCEHRAQAAAAD